MTTRPESLESYTPERIEQLVQETPPLGKHRSIGVIATVATFGSLLFGYDTGVVSGALPYMHMPHAAGGLGMNSVEEGLVGALLALGAALGASLGGRLSDRYGRRHNILMLAVIFLIGALGCTLSPNIWVLYLFRIVLGFAVGGASATVPSYLAETAPQHIRGPLVAMDQFVIVTGQFIAFAANAIIARSQSGPEAVVANDPTGKFASGSTQSWDVLSHITNLTVSGGNGNAWRWMLVLASIPAVALWIGMRLMPESSRWYAANLRIPEAIGALKQIRDPQRDDIAGEINEMSQVHLQEESSEKWSLSQIWAVKWTRRLLVIGVVMGFIDQLTGINTAMYYMPKILAAAGFSTTDSISLNVITGAFSAIGSGVGFLLVHKLSRRQVGIYQESIIVVSLAALAAVFGFMIEPHLQADGTIVGAASIAPILVLVIATIFVFGKQSGTVCWIVLAEIFPAKIRGTAMGMAVGALWIANAIVAAVFPPLIEFAGPTWTYGIFALINVFSLIFYMKVMPETKFNTLEELELKFEREYN